MESRIAKAIETKYPPIAISWSDERPEGAMQFQGGKWGCIMWLAASAAKGRPAVCDAATFGCIGGGVGMGFGDCYKSFPGSEEGFCHFLSSGIEGWDEGPAVAEMIKPFLRGEAYDNFIHGERYIKTPDQVKRFIACLPITQIPKRYVVFRSLADWGPDQDPPQTVVFFANPDELSALVVLANYGRRGQRKRHYPLCRRLPDDRHLPLPGGKNGTAAGGRGFDRPFGTGVHPEAARRQSPFLCHAFRPVHGDGRERGRIVPSAPHMAGAARGKKIRKDLPRRRR